MSYDFFGFRSWKLLEIVADYSSLLRVSGNILRSSVILRAQRFFEIFRNYHFWYFWKLIFLGVMKYSFKSRVVVKILFQGDWCICMPYLLNAEVSLILRRWPRGGSVGEGEGVSEDGGSNEAVLPVEGFKRGALLLIELRTPLPPSSTGSLAGVITLIPSTGIKACGWVADRGDVGAMAIPGYV